MGRKCYAWHTHIYLFALELIYINISFTIFIQKMQGESEIERDGCLAPFSSIFQRSQSNACLEGPDEMGALMEPAQFGDFFYCVA